MHASGEVHHIAPAQEPWGMLRVRVRTGEGNRVRVRVRLANKIEGGGRFDVAILFVRVKVN